MDDLSFDELASTSESDAEMLGDGLKTPLINRRNQNENQSTRSIDTDDTSESDDDTVKTKTGSYPYATAAATALLAVGGVAASASAIIAVPSVAVYIVGAVCILTSPWMAIKQHKIVKEGTGVRKMGNQLRVQSNLLKEEGRILKETVTDLEEEVECLHDIEKEFDGILAEQGWNRDKTVSLVNENEYVLNKIKDCLREAAMADITRIVLSSDKNGDMTINLKELNVLTLRIKLTLEQRGVNFDEETFMALVRKDNCISNVLKVTATIMFKEDSIDDQDFGEYTKEALQETARQDNLVGSMMVAGSALNRLRNIQEKARQDSLVGSMLVAGSALSRMRQIAAKKEKEKSMFTIQDRFVRGSVDSARGSQVSLAKDSQPGRTTLVKQRSAKALKASKKVSRQARRASRGPVGFSDDVTDTQKVSKKGVDGGDIKKKGPRKNLRDRVLPSSVGQRFGKRPFKNHRNASM